MDGKKPEIPRGTRRNRKITGYEEDHTFGRRNGRTYLSGRGGCRGARAAVRRRCGTAVRRRRGQNGDGEGAGAGLPHRRAADCGVAAAHGLAQPRGAAEGAPEHPDGEKDHPRFRGRCGGGLRGLRQRPGVVGCTAAGGADGDSGAELLCRADQQDTVQAGEADLRRLRGHGTLFPGRQDHDDGQSPAGPLLERGSRPGRGVGLLRL